MPIDTSMYDTGGTNQLIAAASNNPQQANAWLSNAQGRQQLSAAQFQLGQQKLQALNSVASSIMADPTPDNLNARLSDAVQQGVITPQMASQAMGQVSGFGGDPDKIKQWAFQHGQAISDIQQRMSSAYGDPTMVNTGNALGVVLKKTGPQGGMYTGGGNPLPLQQSPGELAAPVVVRGPDGKDYTMTRSQFQTKVGQPPGASPYGAIASGQAKVVNGKIVYPGAASANGAPQATDAQGRAVDANGNPTVPQAPAPGAGPQTAAPGALPGIAGPGPLLEGGIKAYQQDLADSSSRMQGVQPLLNALPLIQQLGPQGSGPTSEAFNKAKSTLVSLGIISPDTKNVDAFQEAKKYLNQYVAKSALAGRSDMGQLQQQVSSPSLETSNNATMQLTRNAVAADRMTAATPFAFHSNDLSGYGQHKASFTQQQDLRAYQLDLMPPDQRVALVKEMQAKANSKDAGDRAAGLKFFSSLQNAMDAKVLTLPSSGSNGQ